MNVSVDDLRRWAASQVGNNSQKIWDYLSQICLGPTEPYWEYWCDPTNVETFAETGMGGAHFGELISRNGKRPVVLIAPEISERPCTIVGESLYEFLCLGSRVGFGLIVELPLQPAWTVQQIEKRVEAKSLKERRILKELRSQFGLTPWDEVGNRLFDLQERYLDELEMP